jgi:hypothetical protein
MWHAGISCRAPGCNFADLNALNIVLLQHGSIDIAGDNQGRMQGKAVVQVLELL